jgi:hypothetical protein
LSERKIWWTPSKARRIEGTLYVDEAGTVATALNLCGFGEVVRSSLEAWEQSASAVLLQYKASAAALTEAGLWPLLRGRSFEIETLQRKKGRLVDSVYSDEGPRRPRQAAHSSAPPGKLE